MKISKPAGTIFLNKYTNQRKLGKGAFGDVYLVQDGQGREIALKMIDKKKLQGQNQEMIEYLQGEIQCMKSMAGDHIIELYDVQQDQEFYYMLIEYCDGGDLVNLQALEKKKVFSLQTTTQYLSQVIRGLQQLHKEGYLHRDIKPQNVLLKRQNGANVPLLSSRSSNLQISALPKKPTTSVEPSWGPSSS